MACRTYARTLVISTAGELAVIPNREAVRTSCAIFAALRSALLGTQPVQVQSPPIRFFSTSATLAPSCAAKPAAVKPPEPAPMITRSKSRVAMDDLHLTETAQQDHRDHGHRQSAVYEPVDCESIAQRGCYHRPANRAHAQQHRVDAHCGATPSLGANGSSQER